MVQDTATLGPMPHDQSNTSFNSAVHGPNNQVAQSIYGGASSESGCRSLVAASTHATPASLKHQAAASQSRLQPRAREASRRAEVSAGESRPRGLSGKASLGAAGRAPGGGDARSRCSHDGTGARASQRSLACCSAFSWPLHCASMICSDSAELEGPSPSQEIAGAAAPTDHLVCVPL